jgi:hypothetical protein
VRNGQVPKSETLVILAAAFDRIIEGEDAGTALETRPKKGRGIDPNLALRRAEAISRLALERARKVRARDAIDNVTRDMRWDYERVEELYKDFVAGGNYSISPEGGARLEFKKVRKRGQKKRGQK